LATEYFEEDFLSGIMPVLFAHDCKKAEADILANLATARRGQTLWYSRICTVLCGLHTHHRGRKRTKHSFSFNEIYSRMCSVAFSQVKHSHSYDYKYVYLTVCGEV
jgi:hypothetical protein